MTLMEKLAEAGYAKEDFFHHNSDLYVFANSTTQRVIDEWFKEQNMDRTLFVKSFKDNITGRAMYDVAFQYTPYWEEHCTGVPTKEAVQDEISAAVDEFLEMQSHSVSQPFVDACLTGGASLEDLDKYVEWWHTHDTGNELHEFLGISLEDYSRWLKTDDVAFFRAILDERKNQKSIDELVDDATQRSCGGAGDQGLESRDCVDK